MADDKQLYDAEYIKEHISEFIDTKEYIPVLWLKHIANATENKHPYFISITLRTVYSKWLNFPNDERDKIVRSFAKKYRDPFA